FLIDDVSSNNFGGTYVFFGGVAPVLDANNNVVRQNGQIVLTEITSLERYRRTLLFQQQGLTPSAIAALGGEASQLAIAAGDPAAGVRQWDFGGLDRKSTRLNSSHQIISYAVFCLKKKN